MQQSLHTVTDFVLALDDIAHCTSDATFHTAPALYLSAFAKIERREMGDFAQ
jgi:hypothetical protein